MVQYRYCATRGGGGSCATLGRLDATFPDTVTPTTGATVTNLWNGDLYGFRVAAVNDVGQGDWTTVQQSTPVCSGACPLAPTGLTNTGRRPTYIDLDWSGAAATAALVVATTTR